MINPQRIVTVTEYDYRQLERDDYEKQYNCFSP